MLSATEQNNEDNIQVFLRIRPPSRIEIEAGDLHANALKTSNEHPNVVVLRAGMKTESFAYDAVGAHPTSQDYVFRVVGKPISDNCLQGYNGTIFAYGQTGSGKTFTMQGPIDTATGNVDFEQRGMIPRCFEYLFGMMAREERKSGGKVSYLCKASYCEIYNEFVYDLLDTASPTCIIREDIARGVYVDGITEEIVSSAEEACQLLQLGAKNRHVAETSMNRESSRSHSIFTMIIQSKITDGDINDVRESRFNLVDLAGSERQKLSATTGLRLKEAGNINKSLLALGNVINALVDISNGKQRHVHYRDSKLTFLLRDSLGGNAKTFIIANVSPSSASYGETLSTLRFASRAKMIKNRAVVNQEFQGNVVQLQEEIKRLKHELLLCQTQAASKLAIVDDLDNDQVGDNEEMRMASLLKKVLKRYRESEERNLNLFERIDALEKLVDGQKNQIHSDKMIIKFRESTIASLRRKEKADENQTIISLKEEISMLNNTIKHHPEVNRFAAENLHLRESIQKFENDLDRLQQFAKVEQEWKQYEQQLMNQILVLMGDRDQLSLEIDRIKEKEKELKQTIDNGKMMTKNLQDQLIIANNRLVELTRENSQMENTIDNLKAKEFQEMQKNPLGTSTEEIVQHLQKALEENTRLQKKLESFEVKTRRLSDFANESRQMSQKQIAEMSNRLSNLSMEKTKSDEENVNLKEKNFHLQKEIDRLEQEFLVCEQCNSKKSETIDQLTEQVQTLENRLDEANSELDFLQSHVQTLENSLKNSSKESETKITCLEEEIQRLKQSVGSSEQMAAELSELCQQLNETKDELENMRIKNSEINNQYEKILQELEFERNNVAELHQKYSRERREFETVRAQLLEIQGEKAQWSDELSQVESNRQKLEMSVEMAQNDNIELLERLQNVELENERLRGDVAELSLKLSDSDQRLKAELARIQSISDTLSKLDELQGENKSLEQQFELLLKRNQELEEANGKLVKHNNFKQKLQYHLQIKQENNQLRMENQRLQMELEKKIRSGEDSVNISRRSTMKRL